MRGWLPASLGSCTRTTTRSDVHDGAVRSRDPRCVLDVLTHQRLLPRVKAGASVVAKAEAEACSSKAPLMQALSCSKRRNRSSRTSPRTDELSMQYVASGESVSDPVAGALISNAYSSLSVGLRDLASSQAIARGTACVQSPAPAAPYVRLRSTAPAAVTPWGCYAVPYAAAVTAVFVLLFHVAFQLFPPDRPSFSIPVSHTSSTSAS